MERTNNWSRIGCRMVNESASEISETKLIENLPSNSNIFIQSLGIIQSSELSTQYMK